MFVYLIAMGNKIKKWTKRKRRFNSFLKNSAKNKSQHHHFPRQLAIALKGSGLAMVIQTQSYFILFNSEILKDIIAKFFPNCESISKLFNIKFDLKNSLPYHQKGMRLKNMFKKIVKKVKKK